MMGFAKLVTVVALFVVSAFGGASSLPGVFFSAFTRTSQGPYTTPTTSTSTGTLSRAGLSVGSGLPVRLIIPKINVDANIGRAGLTPLGAMDVPKSPADTAWFALGPRPGAQGSAVISGHSGWERRDPAVFDDVHMLARGDKVYVEDEQGITRIFAVREVRTYDESQDAVDVFNSYDGIAHLNLITCEGVWNATEKSYSNRLVVFTDMED